MKYTVDVQLKPNGTFSITDIIAVDKATALTLAMDNLIEYGYSKKEFKKVTVKEVK